MPLHNVAPDPTGAHAVLGCHQGDVLIMADAVGNGLAASGKVAIL